MADPATCDIGGHHTKREMAGRDLTRGDGGGRRKKDGAVMERGECRVTLR